ncbi:response regulator transcription factor [Cohnella faecalis]|uniref:LuxR family transcriptional regulator n=1 Tax=Cohnella faecalis TaxID=2315694 RepID=A0A398D039_9BACL|nr:helix-turn-helix transcriptional regulator [Cohnella faecalis]RIE04831.1 LuxR family transcriptional regulator [Cohnella faecalis]
MDTRITTPLAVKPASSAELTLEPSIYHFGVRYGMTPRERDVLRLLILYGFKNDDMAGILHIAVKTIKNHLACMMGKTRTRSSRELQALFLRFMIQQSIEKKRVSTESRPALGEWDA